MIEKFLAVRRCALRFEIRDVMKSVSLVNVAQRYETRYESNIDRNVAF